MGTGRFTTGPAWRCAAGGCRVVLCQAAVPIAHGVPPVAVRVVIRAVWYGHFTVRPSMESVLFSVLFYQFFYSNAEGVGQSGDCTNGDVLGLDLSGFNFSDLPGIDAR